MQNESMQKPTTHEAEHENQAVNIDGYDERKLHQPLGCPLVCIATKTKNTNNRLTKCLNEMAVHSLMKCVQKWKWGLLRRVVLC